MESHFFETLYSLKDRKRGEENDQRSLLKPNQSLLNVTREPSWPKEQVNVNKEDYSQSNLKKGDLKKEKKQN